MNQATATQQHKDEEEVIGQEWVRGVEVVSSKFPFFMALF